jgi:hypothetical protein
MKLQVLLILILTSLIFCLLPQQQIFGKTLDHELTNSPIDSIIIPVLDEINPDSIEYYMQTLQDFGTRYCLAPNREEVVEWIYNRFIQMDYTEVEIDSFEFYTPEEEDSLTWQKNIVVTIPGFKRPDEIYILGGHYDSITLQTLNDPTAPAPGADDNSSGTAAVLEIARVLKEQNFQPEATIKLITFAAEEIWSESGSGSENFAQNASNLGLNIKLMVNLDMIAYTEHVLDSSSVNICWYTGGEYYRDFTKTLTQKYTIIEPENGILNLGGDSTPFAMKGFPAIFFMEHEWNPNYHDPTDLVIHCNMKYCAEVTKASCATLIGYMVMPKEVENFTVTDKGDGSSLVLNWSANKDEDMVGYNVYLGTTSNNYDTVFTTLDTSFVLYDLVEGTQYYIGIAVYDSNGYESLMNENDGIPNSIPLAPLGLSEKPLWHAVEISWLNNLEFDLLGYNIYRSTPSLEDTLLKLNTSVLADTFFIDTSPLNGLYHNYYISAIDSSFNESLLSLPIVSRCVSLDQGILIIDETSDGDGTIYNPTDEDVDNFFENIFSNFDKETIDLKEMGEIKLADIGVYSTIIWHGNDFSDLDISQTRIDLLKEYLENGGNFLYTGFVPSEAFEGTNIYPAEYSSGNFIYDYLKIDHVENIFGSRFKGALPVLPGYGELFTDSIKTSANANFHMPYVEGISAGPDGKEIFLYETYFDTSTSQGSMKNEPVGIEYIGEDYKVVTLSFPLYYMNLEESKALIEYIFINKFNEVISVEEAEQYAIPKDFVLYQNYPNPFNPSTKIKFAIPKNESVKIEVYNSIGQKIEALLNQHMKAGHHDVEFNAQNLSSGIYFYKIEAGEFQDVKKMILLK